MTAHAQIDNEGVQTAEDRALELLAYYDARGVSASKLRQIFNCADDHLVEARLTEDYKAYAAEAVAEIENQALTIDETWNALEGEAVQSLRETAVTCADPRLLLGMAVQANKANRRAGSFNTAQANNNGRNGRHIIDPEELAGPTRVVRLRTRFIEQLQRADGARQLIEREIEVTETMQGRVSDDMTPTQVKALLNKSLGIDTNALKMAYRYGPDQQVYNDGLPMIDFSQVSDLNAE